MKNLEFTMKVIEDRSAPLMFTERNLPGMCCCSCCCSCCFSTGGGSGGTATTTNDIAPVVQDTVSKIPEVTKSAATHMTNNISR